MKKNNRFVWIITAWNSGGEVKLERRAKRFPTFPSINYQTIC